MIQKKIWALVCISLLLCGACEVNVTVSEELWEIERTTELRTLSLDDDEGVRNNNGDVAYVIATWRDLEYIGENFTEKTELLGFDYIVTSDITFPNLYITPSNEDGSYAKGGLIPIGTEKTPFTGSFDGEDFTIADVVINRGEENFVGLFGYVEGVSGNGADEPVNIASINNVHLKNIRVTGKNKVGALVGGAGKYIKFIDNSVIGFVNGKEDVGGLIGSISWDDDDPGDPGDDFFNVEIHNTRIEGAVMGENNVGGSIGNINLTATGFSINANINTIYSSGKVHGMINVGGLIGSITKGGNVVVSDRAVHAIYASGDITGKNNVGGLIGRLEKLNLDTGYAVGNVIGDTNVGGSIGILSGSRVHSIYATGNVSGNGDVKEHVGGLVGRVEERATIDTSYATGNVSGHEDIGGLIGVASESSVHTSYATGNVDGDINVGGFIGNMDATSTIENSYSTADVSRDINRRLFIGIKGNGMTTATTPSTNFVKGEDGVFMNVLLEDNGVGIDPVAGENGGVGENFTKENFTWIFEGENAMWHWLEDGKWPILKWQREAQGN